MVSHVLVNTLVILENKKRVLQIVSPKHIPTPLDFSRKQHHSPVPKKYHPIKLSKSRYKTATSASFASPLNCKTNIFLEKHLRFQKAPPII